MMTSGRAAFASSGVISGSGFASAKTIGSRAMGFNISPVTVPCVESPTKTSAPTSASVQRALLRLDGELRLVGVHNPSAPA